MVSEVSTVDGDNCGNSGVGNSHIGLTPYEKGATTDIVYEEDSTVGFSEGYAWICRERGWGTLGKWRLSRLVVTVACLAPIIPGARIVATITIHSNCSTPSNKAPTQRYLRDGKDKVDNAHNSSRQERGGPSGQSDAFENGWRNVSHKPYPVLSSSVPAHSVRSR